MLGDYHLAEGTGQDALVDAYLKLGLGETSLTSKSRLMSYILYHWHTTCKGKLGAGWSV